MLHELESVDHAQLGNIRDTVLVDGDRQYLWSQPFAFTGWAGHLAEVAAVALSGRVGLCLQVLAFDIRNDALKARRVLHFPAVAVLPFDRHLEVVSPQDCLLDLARKLAPWRLE